MVPEPRDTERCPPPPDARDTDEQEPLSEKPLVYACGSGPNGYLFCDCRQHTRERESFVAAMRRLP